MNSYHKNSQNYEPTNIWISAILISCVILIPYFYLLTQIKTSQPILVSKASIINYTPLPQPIRREYQYLVCQFSKTESIDHYQIIQHQDQSRTQSIGIEATCSTQITRSRYRPQWGRNNNYDTWVETVYWKEIKVLWNDRGTFHDMSDNRSYRIITGFQ